MHSKALFRSVALRSLALLAVLALLGPSIPQAKQVARPLQGPWQGLLVTSGTQQETIENHAAPKRAVRVGAARRAKRIEKVKKAEQPALLPIVQQKDILAPHQQILDETLRLLPSWCVDRLKNLHVRYDNPEQRGLAGPTTVILSGNVALSEFRALAGHEILGHFYELGCLEGSKNAVASNFHDGDIAVKVDDPSAKYYAISWIDEDTPRAESTPADFASGYAVSDPFEDLAEMAVAYVFHRDALEKLALDEPVIALKLAWMETYMPLATGNVATGQYTWSGKRPWDMTKLAYEWHGLGNAVVAATR